MSILLMAVLTSSTILALTLTTYGLLRRASASVRHAILLLGLACSLFVAVAAMVFPSFDLPILNAPGNTLVELSGNASFSRGGEGSGAVSALLTADSATFMGLRDGRFTKFLAAIWLAGSVIVFARFILSVRAARRLARSSSMLDARSVPLDLAGLQKRFSLRRPVLLATMPDTFPPMTWGVIRPVILVPSGASRWSAERWHLVLAHELAHVRRCDAFTQVAARAICALYWFNPLAWFASARLRIEQERACDNVVLNSGFDACDYAEHLLHLARSATGNARTPLAVVSMAEQSTLEARLRQIMTAGRNRRPLSRLGIATMIGTALFVTLVLATTRVSAVPAPLTLRLRLPEPPPMQSVISTPVATAQPQPRVSAPQQSERPSFGKWLDEDVHYIISDEERQAFLRLTTDEERQQFIEQFWLRRDPTPPSAQNEFKDEHYRRIAYANARFGWIEAGWRSDRGRVYIQHGKPDEIESHPSGGTYERPDFGGTVATYPFELWTYRYIGDFGANVTFEFVDTGLNGEYRLSQIFKKD